MNSATPATDENTPVDKSVWVEPSVMRIDVGDAEASDGPGPDLGFAS